MGYRNNGRWRTHRCLQIRVIEEPNRSTTYTSMRFPCVHKKNSKFAQKFVFLDVRDSSSRCLTKLYRNWHQAKNKNEGRGSRNSCSGCTYPHIFGLATKHSIIESGIFELYFRQVLLVLKSPQPAYPTVFWGLYISLDLEVEIFIVRQITCVHLRFILLDIRIVIFLFFDQDLISMWMCLMQQQHISTKV